ncbi:unnamed protein product [Calypogeia fissa]
MEAQVGGDGRGRTGRARMINGEWAQGGWVGLVSEKTGDCEGRWWKLEGPCTGVNLGGDNVVKLRELVFGVQSNEMGRELREFARFFLLVRCMGRARLQEEMLKGDAQWWRGEASAFFFEK